MPNSIVRRVDYRLINMIKRLLALACFCGITGCKIDNSIIDESSIVVTRGNIRNDYVEVYVDANVTGLKGYDTILPDQGALYQPAHEMGYTMIYEVYDSQGNLVEKRAQDLGKYGDYTSFSRQELTIPNPQYWSEDNPVLYTLILRLKIVNKPLSTASGRFRLLNDND